MGNICSIFGSSVGKTDLPPSSLRHLGVRSSSSGSIYVDGLGNCADSNGPESFVDNNLSYPSLDESTCLNSGSSFAFSDSRCSVRLRLVLCEKWCFSV